VPGEQDSGAATGSVASRHRTNSPSGYTGLRGWSAECTRCAVAVLLLVAGPFSSPFAVSGQWRVEAHSIGEGIPSWVAGAGSRDGRLEFSIEFSCDGPCTPVVFVRSGGLFNFRRESLEPSIRTEVALTFFPRGQVRLPGYAASGSVYELMVDRESLNVLLGLLRTAERFEFSVPGREGTVAGLFELRGAASATEEARGKCEERFLEDNDFVFQDSAERRLQEGEVAMLSPTMLRIARNEIYARRGHRFTDPLLAAYFEEKPWYAPSSAPVVLTDVERANVALIRSFESSSSPGGRR